VRKGKFLILFCPALDSALFRDSLVGGGGRAIYLGDVNRDSVADIVSGATIGGNQVSDSAVAIDLYSGAAGYTVHRTYFSNVQMSQAETGYFPPGAIETQGITAMTAFDLNADGFDEFLLSYGYKETFQDEWVFPRSEVELRAVASLFYSFPDSIQRTIGSLLINFRPLMLNAQPMLGGMVHSYRYYADMGPDYEWDFTHVSIITLNGQFLRLTGQPTGSLSYSPYYYSDTYSMSFGCAGDIRLSEPGIEVVTHCYKCSDYPGLRLHRIIQQDSTELIWNRTDIWPTNIVYLPEYPGSFFGFSGGRFIQFDGDGNEIQSVTPIPAGTLGWVYPFGPGKPYLQAIVRDTIALYDVAATTGIAGGGEGPLIPDKLAVGAPHPNPFNAAQTIPIHAEPGKHLTVDIFNLLGQKVARIFDARVTAAEFAIPWKAEQLPSGIYLIRATSGDKTVTVKSILLK
jgi:hypothetical protein